MDSGGQWPALRAGPLAGPVQHPIYRPLGEHATGPSRFRSLGEHSVFEADAKVLIGPLPDIDAKAHPRSRNKKRSQATGSLSHYNPAAYVAIRTQMRRRERKIGLGPDPIRLGWEGRASSR